MKSLIIFSCLLVSALAFDLDAEWAQWKRDHNKTYELVSEAEQLLRKFIFGDNLQFIKNHNRRYEQNKETYTVALNEFADLTRTEFNKMFKGFINTPSKQQSDNLFVYNSSIEAKPAVDWRTKKVVTPVKNQAACGSCWAFSATGSLEGQWALKTKKLVSLSEQNLVDCDDNDSGCGGGLMDRAFSYIKQNGGIDTEKSYPYKGVDGKCRFSKSNVGAKVTGFKDIPSEDENALRQAVQTVGPISVAIWADFPGFRFYKSGVLVTDDCPDGALDHGVLAVGYGTLGKQDYWLVKNSWGASWGNHGYILMARNHDNMCGIASKSSYPLV